MSYRFIRHNFIEVCNGSTISYGFIRQDFTEVCKGSTISYGFIRQDFMVKYVKYLIPKVNVCFSSEKWAPKYNALCVIRFSLVYFLKGSVRLSRKLNRKIIMVIGKFMVRVLGLSKVNTR